MDRLSRSILDFMLNIGKTTCIYCSLGEEWDRLSQVSIKSLCDSINLPRQDILAAVSFLERNGYVEYKTTSLNGRTVCLAFHLSHRGLHYKELDKNEQLRFIRHSVIAPVIVSLATNALLFLVRWLW